MAGFDDLLAGADAAAAAAESPAGPGAEAEDPAGADTEEAGASCAGVIGPPAWHQPEAEFPRIRTNDAAQCAPRLRAFIEFPRNSLPRTHHERCVRRTSRCLENNPTLAAEVQSKGPFYSRLYGRHSVS